jgi:hypothetical protein
MDALVQPKTGAAIDPMPAGGFLASGALRGALPPIVAFADVPSVQFDDQREGLFGQRQRLIGPLGRCSATVWHRYNGRAAVELIVKELKADYPLAKIPTGYFTANEAYSAVAGLQLGQLVQAALPPDPCIKR